MKVTLFVTGSAAILAAWLGVTYTQAVPVKSYPQLGRGSVPISSQTASAAPVTAKKPGHLLAKTSSNSPSEAAAVTR